MRAERFYRALTAAVAVTSLSACAPHVAQDAPLPLGATAAPGRSGSWMAVGAKNSDLLYVDVGSGIDVFTYPQGEPAGEITYGDLNSDGLCSDTRGNVYVPVFEQKTIQEFAHGGTQPIATLDMTDYEFPTACAVDPVSGDLAVTTDNGVVGVFKGAKGNPTYYPLQGVYSQWYCTYDGSGNLFAGGDDSSDGFTLAELPYGSSTLERINVPAEISPRLGMQWDGKYLVLEAEQNFHSVTLLRVNVSGSQATVVGKTKLSGPPNGIGTEFWLAEGKVVQPDAANTGVGFWAYPRGGKRTNSLKNVGQNLFAVTVSYGGKR